MRSLKKARVSFALKTHGALSTSFYFTLTFTRDFAYTNSGRNRIVTMEFYKFSIQILKNS